MNNSTQASLTGEASDPKIKTEDIPKITNKSKKDDILSAYQKLMKKFQENGSKSTEKKVEIQRKEEDTLIHLASKLSMNSILEGISNLEGEIKKLLDKLSGNLLEEIKKLKDLQTAVSLEQKRLEEIHDIKVEADTLADLMQAYKEKEKELKEDYQKTEEFLKRQIEAQKEQWKREEDEYVYQLQLKRRKAEAEYEEKRILKEKELQNREDAIKSIETELKELRKMKEEFEERLAKDLEQAELNSANKAREEEKVKAQLLAEKVAADRQISQLTIKALEKKITDQEEEIICLKRELEIANRGVKDIALKVIEGDYRRNETRRPLKTFQNETEKEEKFAE